VIRRGGTIVCCHGDDCPMDSCDVEMCDQWGVSDAPPMRIEGLWLAEVLSIVRGSETSLGFMFVGVRSGGYYQS
jgi:hypothetical protein